jgi:hypothetical protein
MNSGFLSGGGWNATLSWQDLLIGAGGNLSGMSIAADNTIAIRTDTYGGYLYNLQGTAPNGVGGVWQQLITSRSMPATFADRCHGYANNAIFELQIASSNSDIMYMMFVCPPFTYPPSMSVWKSTNKGQTWSLTNLPSYVTLSNYQAYSYRNWGPSIAIDPNNPNSVYVGTPQNGLWYTADGGNTWTEISTGSVPLPGQDGGGNYPGYSGMLIDNNSNVYVSSYGNGVYEFNGSSWSKLTAGTGPVNVQFAAIDFNTGYYFAVDHSTGDLWRWNGTTWYEAISDGTVIAVAADPNLSGHIIAAQSNGPLNESFNSGTSFSGWSSGGPNGGVTLSATNDVLWMPLLSGGIYLSPGWLYFDRTVAKKLYGNGGNDFYVTTPWSGNISTSTDVTWNSQGRGIEQLVANEIVVPAGGAPVVASWDRAVFRPNLSGPYPSTWYPSGDLLAAWSIDYASTNLSFLAILADTGAYGIGSFAITQGASYSTDGGNTWTLFTPPSGTWSATGGGGGYFSGNIALADTTHAIFAPAGGVQPSYTTNFGASPTWTGITLPGTPSWANFIPDSEKSIRVVCADRVRPTTFYLLLDTIGIYRSTNGGATWTQRNNSTTSWGASPRMRAVPGVEDNLWIASGNNTYPTSIESNDGDLNYSTDGGQTWTTAPIQQSVDVGFGAPKPGGSGTPAVFTIGWFTQAISGQSATIGTGNFTFTLPTGLTLVAGAPINFNDGSSNELIGHVVSYNASTGALVINAVLTSGSGTHSSWTIAIYGAWRSDDAGSTWNQIAGWPNGVLDSPACIAGDPSIYGQAYLGFTGQGYEFYGI